MKQRILILCIAMGILMLSAFKVVNWKDSDTNSETGNANGQLTRNTPISNVVDENVFTDFIYDVGTRFSPVKKSKVANAKSIADFLEPEVVASIVSLKWVNVVLFENEKQSDILELGTSETFNDAQLQLLQSFNYSTNFVIRADFQKEIKGTGMLESDYRTPHLTIVPEIQAEYAYGKDVLMTYLRENSKKVRVGVDPKKLQPAKLTFLVTKKGAIEVIGLDRSSGYPRVDKKMIELISNTPGPWKPAKNMAGVNVDQQLVVSFGLMGC